ncbi:MAG: MOSC domain-containing protein [Pandoraea sp.]|nr:MOSC domain-containing protein [Pandoraea sp.]MDR3398853.1 MOSC domain-containing protein [Pandoraea sp.]
MTQSTTINHLFAGGTGHLEPDGHRSGIFKRRITGRIRVESSGIVGDEHADPRVHGGPEKAVHHYAEENYGRIAQAFPESAPALVPGSLGENLSTQTFSGQNVHIGDTFLIGDSVVLQVSQPRRPCWKINHRFGVEGLSMFVARERVTGWYYRVISPGFIEPGDTMVLVERQTDRFSIDQFWQVQLTHRPSLDDLVALGAVPGLAPEWQRRMTERVKWLQERPEQAA